MAKYVQKTLMTEHLPDMTVSSGGGSDGAVSLTDTKIYRASDVWNVENRDEYTDDGTYLGIKKYIQIVDPEVIPDFEFFYGVNVENIEDNIGRSDDGLYVCLTNLSGRIYITIANSFASQHTGIDQEDFYAVVYERQQVTGGPEH